VSTEVTPESIRTDAKWLISKGFPESSKLLRMGADDLERAQARPLPTEPGWYPGIVVERGGESCTGALLRDDGLWQTPRLVSTFYSHRLGATPAAIIRWAEQDGTTPGQTLWEAQEHRVAAWRFASPEVQGEWERMAAAVLAAHGTPTLTPVGEHPKPGTRGLLPLVLEDGVWQYDGGAYCCHAGSEMSTDLLADPRPDGAL